MDSTNQNKSQTVNNSTSEKPNTVSSEMFGELKVEKKEIQNMNSGAGINLIPRLTTEEVVVEEKKSALNIWSAISVLILVLVSLVIFGVNFAYKLSYTNEKKKSSELESSIIGQSDVINKNYEILKRVRLYEDIKKNSFSPKSILSYWQDFLGNMCTINSVEIDSNLKFNFSGKTKDLTEAAKIWHYLSMDSRIKTVNLKAISKTETEISFEFEGQLDSSKFVTEKQ